mgnify:CR=1 FL=1
MSTETSEIESLQTRLAYVEQSNEQLSSEVYEQQRQLEKVTLRLDRLEKRMTEMASSLPDDGAQSLEDNIPPHY